MIWLLFVCKVIIKIVLTLSLMIWSLSFAELQVGINNLVSAMKLSFQRSLLFLNHLFWEPSHLHSICCLSSFCVVFHPGDHFMLCLVADEWYMLSKQRGNNRDVSSTNSKYFWAWLEFWLDISSKLFKDNSKVISKIVNIHWNFKRMSVNHKTMFVFKINFYSSLDLCLSHFLHQI